MSGESFLNERAAVSFSMLCREDTAEDDQKDGNS